MGGRKRVLRGTAAVTAVFLLGAIIVFLKLPRETGTSVTRKETQELPHTLPVSATQAPPRTIPLTVSICAEPTTIRVGTVDPAFELSTDEFKTAIRAAAQEWADATGREWFRFSDDGKLTVNLLFDDRQRALLDQYRERRVIREELNGIFQASLKITAERFEVFATAHRFSEAITANDANIAAFREEVARWKSGEQPAGVTTNSLDIWMDELTRESERIEAIRLSLLPALHRIDQNERELDERRDELKARLEKLGSASQFDRPYPCGQHLRTPLAESIDIFAFADRNDLHLTLMHELGHAMGLQHSNSSFDVMHPIHDPDRREQHLSDEDVGAAQRLCGAQ